MLCLNVGENGTHHLIAVVSCRSGGDDRAVEQAGQSVPRSSVDHHPGYSSWVVVARPAHISTIQGTMQIK